MDFVVEADRGEMAQVVQRVRDGRLRTNIGTTVALVDAVATLSSAGRRKGRTVVTVRS